jgi:hypothetical protein
MPRKAERAGVRVSNLAEKIAAIRGKRDRLRTLLAEFEETGESQISLTDPDIGLLAAEQEFHQIAAQMGALRNAGADENTEIDPVFMRWMAVMDLIEITPPLTLAGCAAKLRVLMHEEVGLPTGEAEHDMTCLEQVRDFLNAVAT